jgi:hypothetical protein
MMQTMVLKADERIVTRLVSLFDLFPKDGYELFVSPYSESEQRLDELARTVNFDDDEQVQEFCAQLSDVGKTEWWAHHRAEYLQGVPDENRH